MEEYTQMTLSDWWAVKEDIRRKLNETAENFIYIGCRLKVIKQSESYKQDGAADIYEFAEKEYGLHRTTTQRFMAINTKFSIGGNSTELLPEFKNFGSSKLQEMLTLSEDDCQLITEDTTIKEIRDLKAFSKQDPEGATEEIATQAAEISYTPLDKCIIDYFSKQERRQTLNAVLKMQYDNEISEEVTKQQMELINPSEYSSHTKGVIYLFMYEYDKGIAYKSIMDGSIKKMTWEEFTAKIARIYAESYGPDTWRNYYGPIVETVEPVKEQKETKKEEPKTAQKPQNTESEECATSHISAPEEAESVEECTEVTEEVAEESAEEQAEEAEQEEILQKAETEQPTASSGIVENPYYKLQEAAVRAAEQIAYKIKMNYHLTIPEEEMNSIKAEQNHLAAVIEQLEAMREER